MSEEEKPPEPPLRSIDGGKGARGRSGPVTHEIYERMAVVYLAGARSVSGIVKALRADGYPITEKTARKAINRGWPEHKWPPLVERAELHDKLHAASTHAADPKRATAARDFLKMREDYLTIAAGLRAGIARAIKVINDNALNALATQVKPVRQVHYEEVMDARGRVVRRIPRTLTVDVTMAPSVFDIAQACNQLAAALERTGGGEIGQLMAKPPVGATGRRQHSLTVEQLQEIATNGGALPPGVTLEQLGDF